jgi:DNA-binding response OmpR family regulator
MVDSFAPFQRILAVDDDPAILCMVREKLERAGFEVLTAGSAQDGLEMIEQHGLPHLAIVDIRMPCMDGFKFLEVVQEFSDLPAIMLTAVDEEDTVIRAIEYFAEDYITKPFSPRELVARVRRVLRRMGDFAYALEPLVGVDERLSVDFGHQQALVAGEPVSLTPTETKILYILMRNAGHTVTSGFLLRRLWPMEEVFEDALRVHVHRLRKKIEPAGSEWRYICTARGVGYQFIAPGMPVRRSR